MTEYDNKCSIQAGTEKVWNNTALLNAVKSQVLDGGLPSGHPIGIIPFDNLCRFEKGRVVTIAGDTASGKSSFIYYLVSQLYKTYNWKPIFYSGEESTTDLVIKFDRLIETDTENPTFQFMIDDDFHFIRKDGGVSYQDIINDSLSLISQGSKIDIVVIDSYNRLVFNSGSSVETERISNMLRDLSDFAMRTNTLVFVISHMAKRDNRTPLSMNSISGSAHWANNSDYVILTERNDNNTNITVAKVKFSEWGTTGSVQLAFDASTGLFFDKEYMNSSYHERIMMRDGRSGKDILEEVEVNLFKTVESRTCGRVNLWNRLTTVSEEERLLINKIRTETDEDIQKIDKKKLPMITISALYNTRRTADNIVLRTGLICLDFDEKDNPGRIEALPGYLRTLPYIAFFAKSVRGKGYFAIVPIDNPDDHEKCWEQLQRIFMQQGFIVDPTTKDISRTRFISYDENYYVNPKTSLFRYAQTITPIIPQVYITPTSQTVTDASIFNSVSYTNSLDKERFKDVLNKAIAVVNARRIDVVPSYNEWLNLCWALVYTLGDEGRYYFHCFSRWSIKYNVVACNNQYATCTRYINTNTYHYSYESVLSVLRTAGCIS